MELLVCSVAAAQFHEPALLSLPLGHQLSCCNVEPIPTFSQTFLSLSRADVLPALAFLQASTYPDQPLKICF